MKIGTPPFTSIFNLQSFNLSPLLFIPPVFPVNFYGQVVKRDQDQRQKYQVNLEQWQVPKQAGQVQAVQGAAQKQKRVAQLGGC